MISTTFKDGSKFTLLDWFFVAAKSSLLLYAAVLIISTYGCGTPQQTQHVRARIVTAPQGTEERPIYPPAGSPALAEKENREEPKKAEEPPYYGSTYWDELLTSVYYYPAKGGDSNDLTVPSTHLKFGHRDDSIWLCGDQRKSFSPGTKYRLLVTFEPNQPCVSNWKIE
jgi:hypothetical protein